MIAVTGATGHLGRLVLAELLARGAAAKDLVAIVRDAGKAADLAAQGVAVRTADYKRPETLGPALAGVDKLLLISSNDFDDRAGQHRNVVQAARAAGVGLIAYASILRADASPIALAADHKATEAAIAASGIPAILLRHGWYSENYAAAIGAAPRFGMIGSAGTGRISAAARADYAAADAAALLDGTPGVYELAGDDSFTMDQLAAMVAEASGAQVSYTNMPEAAYRQALIGMGLPEGAAAIFAQSDAQIPGGWLHDESRTLSRLIGRPTTPMAQTVRAVLAGTATPH